MKIISHGICSECKERVEMELKDFLKRRQTNSQ